MASLLEAGRTYSCAALRREPVGATVVRRRDGNAIGGGSIRIHRSDVQTDEVQLEALDLRHRPLPGTEGAGTGGTGSGG